jgi:hypothetical protein
LVLDELDSTLFLLVKGFDVIHAHHYLLAELSIELNGFLHLSVEETDSFFYGFDGL